MPRAAPVTTATLPSRSRPTSGQVSRESRRSKRAPKIRRLVGKSLPIGQDDSRLRPVKSEVERLRCDNALARTLLGWEPTVSLTDGLTRAISWVREHLDAYRVGRYQT
jgi:nucleoside-diphosphate-sugar epimerase